MTGRQQVIRSLAITIALALIVGAFFNFNFLTREEPKPLLRLDTPQANPSPVDEGLDFSAPGLDGREIDLSHYRGHPVIVDFWATWCGPCRAELPHVIATYKKYHDQGFEIIGISLDQDQAKLTGFTKSMNMTWPQFFDGQGWQNKLAVKYGIQSIPATFLLDGEGKIIGKDLRGKELEQAVAKAVANK